MDFDLLSKIVALPGAPGFEKPIRLFIEEQLRPHVDELYTDGMGNLIARIHGGSKKVMFAAHLDEIALIVTHIDKNGFIRFHTLGGFDAKTLSTQRVHIHGKSLVAGVIGSKAVHLMSQDERNKAPKVEDFFIDTGLPAEEVKELIPIGSPITRDRELAWLGNSVTGKSLDNRISVYILLEALKRLKKETQLDLYATFTVQEEVGIRGARVAAHHIQPEIGIALDITLANDTPGAEEHKQITQLGRGTAIKVLDGSVICTPELVSFAEETAIANKITYQRELLTAGGTDTSGLQYLTGIGAQVTCVSTPTRYVHSTVEMAHKDDIGAGIQLTLALMKSLHKYSM